MTTISQDLVLEERVCRVDELDLDPVVFKLLHPEPGAPHLTLAAADRDAELYRCFLKLCVLYPGRSIVPTRDIDHVWHTHMLDTAKHRFDCDRVFGRCLDHFPYAGLRGEEDRRAWRADFARTRMLFTEHFGVEIGAEPAASVCVTHGGDSDGDGGDGADCCVGCVKPPAVHSRPRPARRAVAT